MDKGRREEGGVDNVPVGLFSNYYSIFLSLFST